MGDSAAGGGTRDRFRRPGTPRSLELGSLRVSFVPDGVVKMVPAMLFPGMSPEDWADHRLLLDDSGWLTITSGGLLVEAGDRALPGGSCLALPGQRHRVGPRLGPAALKVSGPAPSAEGQAPAAPGEPVWAPVPRARFH